jgi:hypothetical protein
LFFRAGKLQFELREFLSNHFQPLFGFCIHNQAH